MGKNGLHLSTLGPLNFTISGTLRHFVFLSICCLLLIHINLNQSFAKASAKKVLIINSYHKGLSWTDNIIKGIDDTFKGQDVELYHEFLDTKRFPDSSLFKDHFNLFKDKYSKMTFDVIIVSDNDALDFMLKYHSQLFPNIPVVFCGINNFNEMMLKGNKLFTGVVEETDIKGTLSIIKKLHSKAKDIYVINDKTTTGLAMKKEFYDAIKSEDKMINVIYYDDFSIDELKEEIKKIPQNSVIFMLLVNRDRFGSFFAYEESFDIIYQVAKAPIYSVWDFYLSRGMVGGMLTSAYHQGKSAGEIAHKILSGTPVSSIEIIKKSPNKPMFDYKELRRFDIKESLLPDGSIVINKPETFYTQYQSYIIAFLLSSLVLIAIIFILSANIMARRKMELSLRESEDKYRDLYDNAPDMYHTINKYGIVTECNLTESKMLGYSKDEIIGRHVTDFFTQDAKEQFIKDFPRFAVEKKMLNLEREFVRKDGSTFPALLNVYATVDQDGQLISVRAIARDITAIKETEKALLKSEEQLRLLYQNLQNAREEERRYIAREIHDELGQLLSFIKIEVSWLKNRLCAEDMNHLCNKANSLINHIDRAITFVQRLTSQLRPAVLEHLELSEALQWFVNQTKESSHIEILSHIEEHLHTDTNRATTIFRIVQEAVTNVIRHSEADKMWINLSSKGNNLEIIIIDNGSGIPPEAMNNPKSFGLMGMKERVEALNGTIEINSQRNKGTTVKVIIPKGTAEDRE